jgi:hypothetical protein
MANYKSLTSLLDTSYEFESRRVKALIVVLCHQAGLVLRHPVECWLGLDLFYKFTLNSPSVRQSSTLEKIKTSTPYIVCKSSSPLLDHTAPIDL